GDEQVGSAIAIDVRHRHRTGIAAGGEGLLGGKTGRGGAGGRRVDQNRQREGECVGNEQVGSAIAIDVRRRHEGGAGTGGESLLGGETGRGGAGGRRVQQHRHREGGLVGDEQVGSAIAIDVRRRHQGGIVAGGEGLLGGETRRGGADGRG